MNCESLESIEIPPLVKQIDKILQNEMLKCVQRLGENLFASMKENNTPTKIVTIGIGHNDINSILKNKFKVCKAPKLLENYLGYTDAKEQYILYENKGKKETKRDNFVIL